MGVTRHIIRQLSVTLSPEELAEEFCEMDAAKQVAFFNEIASQTASWRGSFSFQLQAIIDDPTLTPEGRTVMKQIGEYGECNNG